MNSQEPLTEQENSDEPITWCQIFSVGPACRFPCADCKRTNRALQQQRKEQS